jgi:VanZ family protein
MTTQQRNALHILICFIFGFAFSFADLSLWAKLAVGNVTVFILGVLWERNQVYLTQNENTFDWWDIVRNNAGFIIGLLVFHYL